MHVTDVETLRRSDEIVLRAVATSPLLREAFVLEHAVRGAPEIPPSGDPFLAACLPAALALGEDLTIDAPVSGVLLEAAPTIVDVLSAWWPHFRQPRPLPRSGCTVRAPVRDDGPAPPDAGLFFSCGVDSFYTLLGDLQGERGTRRRPLTHLIYVDGLGDTWDPTLLPRIEANVRRVANAVGTSVITVRTNLRSLLDPLVHWSLGHGPVLGSVALALRGTLGTVVTSSTFSYADLQPLGTHPLLDPLWSTEEVAVRHEGAEARRVEKVLSRIARSPLALGTLRVCEQERIPDYNCGRCLKCLRAMISLHIAGALEGAATFPGPFDLDRALQRLIVDRPVPLRIAHEFLSALDPASPTAAAVRRSIARRRRRDRTRFVRRPLGRMRRWARSVVRSPRGTGD